MHAKGSYYLLDNEVKYYPASKWIVHPDHSTQLTDFQHKLFLYFLKNPGVVRSQDQICSDVWPNKVTTVDAFNKPLGAIRNALSNNDRTRKDDYIKTWVREGYSLVCSCRFIEEDPPQPVSRVWPKRSIAIAALLVGLGVGLIATIQPAQYVVTNALRLTSMEGIQAEPALSEDGEKIAFVSYDRSYRGSIYAKRLSERDAIRLTQGHSDKMPSWSPSAKQLLYQRQGENLCELRLLKLDDNLTVLDDRMVYQCSPHAFYVSSTWASETSFFYTDRKGDLTPQSIYRHDLNSGLSELYLAPPMNDNSKGTGYARIINDRQNQRLYIIQSPDWYSSDVLTYEQGRLTKQANIDVPLNSVAIFKDNFIYKDSSNRLRLSNQPHPLTTGWIGPIQFPTTSISGNKVAFFSGHMYHWNIFAYDVQTQVIHQKTFDSAMNRFPLNTVDDLFYTSNFTGITQVYRQPPNSGGSAVLLTNFKQNQVMTQVSISHGGEMLAISYRDHTDLYRLDRNSLELLYSFKNLIYPSFSNDGSRLLLARISGNTSNIVEEYRLDTMTLSGISIPGARLAVYHPKGGIIFAKTDTSGLYRFDINGETTLDPSLSIYLPAQLAITEDAIFVNDQATLQVKKLDLNGENSTNLPLRNVGQISYRDGKLYYTFEQFGKSSIFVGDIMER